MSVLARISLILGLVLLLIGVILATMNFIVIRDYVVALQPLRDLPPYNVNPRVGLTYLIVFASGFLLGMGVMISRLAGRRRPE
jgi:hypothetical protein